VRAANNAAASRETGILASWELRIALQTLLAAVSNISLAPQQSPEREVAPVGGYHRVPVILTEK
jgi:hypothetical protein